MATALLFTTFAKAKKGGRYLDINNLEKGNIRIADSTFKDMINKNAKAVIGVTNSKTSVKNVDNQIHIGIKAELVDDVVIPQVCADIQSVVKTNIEAMCGIEIAKVNIVVENKTKD
jgi:uncharacterized alkaline shock family protein YloU